MDTLTTEEVCMAFKWGARIGVPHFESTGDRLLLNGNMIAQRKDGSLFISDAGVRDEVTRHQLNQLLCILNATVRIYTNEEDWYIDDVLLPTDTLVRLKHNSKRDWSV